MKRCLCLLGTCVLLGAPPALGCGDKFLVVGRGTRFQQRPARAEGHSVLVYAPPASAIREAFGGIPVERVLRRAGHRPALAASENELAASLERGGTDVVLADLRDARQLRERPGALSATVILPVLVNPTRSELEEARRAWGVVLGTPVKRTSLLDAVDEALERRREPGDLADRSR